MSENGAGVLAADNREISVILGEDDSFNSSVTEVKRNGNISATVIVNILDVVGGFRSVDGVAVIVAESSDGGSSDGSGVRSRGNNNSDRSISSSGGTREVGLHIRSGTENLTVGVDDGNTEAGILKLHVSTRAVGGEVISGVVVPVDVGTEDGASGQLFHQFSSAPLGFEVDASKGFKTVDSLATFGGATLFNSGDGSEGCKSSDD